MNIVTSYSPKKNPFRNIFVNNENFVACDFSVLIPAWKLKISEDYVENLLKQAVEYAESKNYYSFYSAIPASKWDMYYSFVTNTIPNYIISIEETVPSNEKPVSTLFWNWIVESRSFDYRQHIVYHFLPQEFRNELF